jgi:hypothetical protein
MAGEKMKDMVVPDFLWNLAASQFPCAAPYTKVHALPYPSPHDRKSG